MRLMVVEDMVVGMVGVVDLVTIGARTFSLFEKLMFQNT